MSLVFVSVNFLMFTFSSGLGLPRLPYALLLDKILCLPDCGPNTVPRRVEVHPIFTLTWGLLQMPGFVSLHFLFFLYVIFSNVLSLFLLRPRLQWTWFPPKWGDGMLVGQVCLDMG